MFEVNTVQNVRQNVFLCLMHMCDSRPSTSIAQSMQAIVLSHHHHQDRVLSLYNFITQCSEGQQRVYAPELSLHNLIEVLK